MPDNGAVDLTNCDREPIHLLGAVQSFGFLLAVSTAEWRVTRASRNAADFLGVASASLIGKPLTEIFTADAIHAIRGHLQTARLSETVARAFGLTLTAGGSPFDIAVHDVVDAVIIECEPCRHEPQINAGTLVRGMLARMQTATDLRAFYRVAAREMRALTGFDRVMIYRFDFEGSGEVIAESARAGLESYLGLHYPASDIPRQARILYERNWLRIISDVGAEPSPVEPVLDGNGRPIDLSMSILRSVSRIHIEYLRNMGVGASMSVSILRDGRLWGLFACHHYSPHHVGFERRTGAELFGQMFSLQLESRERDAERQYEIRAQTLHNKLITAMAGEARQFESVVSHLDEIADLLICDGIGVSIHGRSTLKGLAPTQDQFDGLLAHLKSRDVGEVHASHEIGAEYAAGKHFADRAAGMLLVPLSRPSRDYLIFFRKESQRSVNWAGDPNKPVIAGPLGDRLTPRKSFELWKETVQGQSLPWLGVERRIAESLRVSLLEVILRLSDLTEYERRRAEERQELLIAELNHRVRNILSLIRAILSQSRSSASTIDDYIKVFGGRIQSLARAHDQITTDNWGPASFRGLINAETGAYLGGKGERVVISGSDFLLTPEAFTTVALVMHEMITNSAKYGALSDNRGRVDIALELASDGRARIAWAERGGPAVKPPTRRGFGSTVIERSIPYDLRGEAQVEYALAGLRARFEIPGNHIRRAPAASSNGESPPPSAPASDLPRSVLLVEDNVIIALDTEAILLKLGVADVQVANSVSAALRIIEERPPNFALLDVNLGVETSFEIAERLAELKVPFAFATGYGEQIAFPPALTAIPRLSKPYSSESLQQLMQRATAKP